MRFTKIKSYVGIGISSMVFSGSVLANTAVSNVVSDTNMGSNVENLTSEGSVDVNPFLNLSTNIEKTLLENREKQNELELAQTMIELDRRAFQQEILPYQMEIQRLQLQRELTELRNEISQNQMRKDDRLSENREPSFTLDDVDQRVQRLMEERVAEKEREIKALQEKNEQLVKNQNTFQLHLISRNKSGLYAVISNKEGERFTISENDSFNNWAVKGIDEENERVVVRKGSDLQILSFDNKISLIKNNSTSVSSSSSENTDNESNENNEPEEYVWYSDGIPRP